MTDTVRILRLPRWPWDGWGGGGVERNEGIICVLTLVCDAELRIHEYTERGDNDTVKIAGGKTVTIGGGCCSA